MLQMHMFIPLTLVSHCSLFRLLTLSFMFRKRGIGLEIITTAMLASHFIADIVRAAKVVREVLFARKNLVADGTNELQQMGK